MAQYIIDWWETLVLYDGDLDLRDGQVRVETELERHELQALVEDASDGSVPEEEGCDEDVRLRRVQAASRRPVTRV